MVLRKSKAKARVKLARTFLESEPDSYHFSYPLGRQAKVRPALLYSLLSEFLSQGYLFDSWTLNTKKRWLRSPRAYERRQYRATVAGREHFAKLIRDWDGDA